MERFPIRLIRVLDVTHVTPRTKRVTFGGPDLADFVCAGPDQQVRLYFPRPGQTVPRVPPAPEDGEMRTWYRMFDDIPEPERPPTRGYTIRSHDPERGVIAVDFGMHGGSGPAARWSERAAPGDVLAMFGPPPGYVRPIPMAETMRDVAWTLLVGDESAVPAIATLLEALPEGARATAFVEVADAAEEVPLPTRGEATVHWLHRGATPPGRGDALLRAVRAADFPPGPVFAWLAGEAGQVRAVRRHLVNERGIDKRFIDFTGYWRSRRAEDDARSAQELADEREWEEYFQGLVDQARARREPTPVTPRDREFQEAYERGETAWVIDEPQPVVVELERAGLIAGRVLDAGCGTGEHTVLLASLGYDVRGVDFSGHAVRRARAHATERGVPADFAVADVLRLDEDGAYDTVLDSALFHVFGPADRAAYVRVLHRLVRPGGRVHVLAMAEAASQESGSGPWTSDATIKEAFASGWELEEVRASRFRVVRGEAGTRHDVPAWLARVRRSR